jgi:hypothetical protein
MEDFFMCNVPEDNVQKPKPVESVQNISESNGRTEPPASGETARDKFMKIAAQDPRFIEVKNSGLGFVIVGAKPK